MSQDLLIPFMPRIVQNKLEPPRLNVKKVRKEAIISQDERDEDSELEKYDENNLVVSQREQNKHRNNKNAQSNLAESLIEEGEEEGEEGGEKESEADTEENEHSSDKTNNSQVNQLKDTAGIVPSEHPIYDIDEILHEHQTAAEEKAEADEKAELAKKIKHIDITI